MQSKRYTLLYSGTIFLSAALMFVLEPMFAKLLLPLVGGAPAVWPASMAFYQMLLLAGYGFSHLLSKFAKPMVQVGIALLVVGLPILLLPVGLPSNLDPPVSGTPVYWLLATMALAIGAPFFALCTLSPLLQRWFSMIGERGSSDPYFLYAASNAGSMLALLSYPFFIEPLATLRQQSWYWTTLYVCLAIVVATCGIVLVRNRHAIETSVESPDFIPLSRRARWVFLAFVPSSLVLGLTTFLTTDVAAVPLLWVLPLSAYLLSFIIVFARRQVVPHYYVLKAFPWFLAAMIVFLAIPIRKPFLIAVGVQFLGFFVTALAAHGELAKDRPAPSSLTGYYFMLALGGVLGGIFNALIAPSIFHSVAEYPLAALLACFIVTGDGFRNWKLLWQPALVAAIACLVLRFATGGTGFSVVIAIMAVIAAANYRRFWWFAGGLGAVMLVGQLFRPNFGTLIDQRRSFFGVLRVIELDSYRYLYHGTTLHGSQDLWGGRDHIPLTYYYPNGPIGQVFASLPRERLQRVGLVGLGAGSILSYAQPGQKWTVYEIDPLVVSISTNPQYFTYISNSKVRPNIVLGDARLQLTRASESYDLLILDAYSSDAVPVHLLTREALQVYLSRLLPHGVLAFHISNSRVDLEPLVKILLDDAELSGLLFFDHPVAPEDEDKGKNASLWVIAARTPADLEFSQGHGNWQPLQGREGLRLWTDDYSSLWSLLKL